MRQGELHSLANLLLLHVHAAHVAVLHVRSLGVGEQRDAGVRLGGEDVHERVGVAVERDRRAGLEQLAVQSAQDADVVVAPGGGGDDTRVLVHHLQELTDHEGHRLDALHLLLRAKQLDLEVFLLILDVLLLDLHELQLALQLLQTRVQILLRLVLRGMECRRRPP